MAVLSSTHLNLLQVAMLTDPNGKTADVVQMLNQNCPILDDMVWKPGNLPTGHQSTIQVSMPTPAFRDYYGGVVSTTGGKARIVDRCAELTALSDVDASIASLGGDINGVRAQEDKVQMEAMSQTMATTLFYGNDALNPSSFLGFAPRYSSLSSPAGENIIVGGGSGSDNASIWLIGWGDDVFGIYPPGSKAGLQHTDFGYDMRPAPNGGTGEYPCYRSYFQWNAGLCVRDWRYVVRIANIDKSSLSATLASGADLANLLFQARDRIPNLERCRPAIYASRDIITMLAQQTSHKTSNSTLTVENVGGTAKVQMMWQGIPVRRSDSLAADEALVS